MSSRTRRGRERAQPATILCPRLSRRNGVHGCARARTQRAVSGGRAASAATMSFSSTGPGSAMRTTTRPGSSTRPSERWFGHVPWELRTGGCSQLPPPDCLFCRLVAEGDHLHAADGFVAIRDISPAAEAHLLVLPELHIDTVRDMA